MVTAVIPNWNGERFLDAVLGDLAAQTEPPARVIVVDNGSSDGTQAMLAQEFPAVRVIQHAESVGFGRGNNIEAQASLGRALLLLNSDCELSPGALEVYDEALHRA